MRIRMWRYAGVCALAAGAAAHAADTPPKGVFQKPLRIIVPFAPGGGQDGAARLVASKLTEFVGQQVIVDNRPGASGIIAAETLLKAPPDGHTMYLASTSFVVSPSLRASLPYDTLNDFAAVTRVAVAPGTLVVHASLPVRNVRELMRLASQSRARSRSAPPVSHRTPICRASFSRCSRESTWCTCHTKAADLRRQRW